ncbi:MAG: NYN domain-containing protein [Candidatus Methylomirabilales bacterium]
MPPEPAVKRTVAFIYRQNLFHAARESFGYTYPNFDVLALARLICQRQGWQLGLGHFYTGIPDPADDPFWNYFWQHKLAMLGRQGVTVYSRPLRYRNRRIRLPDGTEHTYLAGEEKGIDVRIALDVVRMAHWGEYDVALVFSQDQDLSEVAEEVRTIAKEHDRWLKIACAYPLSPTTRNRRGINKTDWIPIDRAMYDLCLDLRDYRPPKASP